MFYFNNSHYFVECFFNGFLAIIVKLSLKGLRTRACYYQFFPPYCKFTAVDPQYYTINVLY